MLQNLIEALLRSAVGKMLTSQTVQAVAEKIRAWVHTAIDAGFTYVVAYILANLPSSDGGTVIPFLCQSSAEPPLHVVGSTAVLFMIISALTRLAWPLLLSFLSNLGKPAAIVALLLCSGSACYATEIIGQPQVGPDGYFHLTAKLQSDLSDVLWKVRPTPTQMDKVKSNEIFFNGPQGTRYEVEVVEIGPAPAGSPKPFFISEASGIFDKLATPTPGPTPGPLPGPGPSPVPIPPVPTPTPPETEFGLAKWAYGQASVMQPDDRKRAVEVAKALRASSSALAAGGLKNPNEFLLEIKSTFNANGVAWQGFTRSLGDELRRQSFGTKPATAFVSAGNELATGLDFVK